MGNFFILSILVCRLDCASSERTQRCGQPAQHTLPNWKKQVAKQAFAVSMHFEARGMRRWSQADLLAAHRIVGTARQPVVIWRSEQVSHRPTSVRRNLDRRGLAQPPLDIRSGHSK
jgi:hypothetical protein